MGRPRKPGVKLSTRVPERVLRDLQLKAAEINGSLGDAVAVIHSQYREPADETKRLLLEAEEAKRERDGAIEALRFGMKRAEKAEKRLAQMSAASKAKGLRYSMGAEE